MNFTSVAVILLTSGLQIVQAPIPQLSTDFASGEKTPLLKQL
jgi:hypothetical protein